MFSWFKLNKAYLHKVTTYKIFIVTIIILAKLLFYMYVFTEMHQISNFNYHLNIYTEVLHTPTFLKYNKHMFICKIRSTFQKIKEKKSPGWKATKNSLHYRPATEAQIRVRRKPLSHGEEKTWTFWGTETIRITNQNMVPKQTCKNQEIHGRQ